MSSDDDKKRVQPPLDFEQLYEEATGLFSTGANQQAKALLGKILRSTSQHFRATRLLEKIQKQELEDIFKNSSTTPQSDERGSSDSLNVEETIRKLEDDLDLRPVDDQAVSLFDPIQIETQMMGASSRDRLDLGIAFYEMRFFDLAIQQFRKCTQIAETAAEMDVEVYFSGKGLLATCYIEIEQFFEAILILTSSLSEASLPEGQKPPLMYLLGVAYEAQGNAEEALLWYRQLARIQPQFRDVSIRLKGLS